MPKLSQSAIDSIKFILDDACSSLEHRLPGAVVIAVNKQGNEIFTHVSGVTSVDGFEAINLQSVFWLASCTKLLTGIACMQLVERGRLSLDDPDQVERLCPELAAVKVLREDGKLEEKRGRITLRLLLTHTAGFGYSFANEKLARYSRPVGFNEFSGQFSDICQPLVHQPGTNWEYGVGVDWAGVLVERISGLSLDNYLQQNILRPLGLKDISMFPDDTMKSRIVHMHSRDSSGVLSVRDHVMRTPLTPAAKPIKENLFNSGGAGCFGTPRDFSHILAVLLNDGTCPLTNETILSRESIQEMFRNQLSDIPDFGRHGVGSAKPEIANPLPQLYPNPKNLPQGFGMTFMITGGVTGRSGSTAHWIGLPNIYWWCDREKEVAGMVCTQILPAGDPQAVKVWFDVETAIYKGLEMA